MVSGLAVSSLLAAMYLVKGTRMSSPLPRCAVAHRAPISLLLLLVALNLLAWAWALIAFADHPALLGTALLAYLFGLRHAVDADHIAAIDNVVRKLMRQGGRPFSVGFFFSVGHSTLIVVAVAVIVTTTSVLEHRVDAFKEIGDVISTAISAFFLFAVAITNLVILGQVWKSFRRLRNGEAVSDEDIDMLISGNGLLARLFRPMFRVVTKSWHMFPLGFLFGLGFDTATEVGLFSVTAGHASKGLSLWSVMTFPVLFTAGMALIDTLDSVLMVGAYGWAFVNPLRKIWYNLTITSASVLVALLIGGIEALGLLVRQLKLSGEFWDRVSSLNEAMAHFGYLVIGVFILSWAVSFGIYKWKGYDRLPGRV